MYRTYELLEQLATEHKLDIHKEGELKKLFTVFKSAIIELRKNPTFIYGKRTEHVFFQIVKALSSVRMIKEEDGSKIYTTSNVKTPDFKIITNEGKHFYVEVKNFSPDCSPQNIQKHIKYEITQQYYEQLKEFAKIDSTPIKIAIFWRKWNLWTLNNLGEFKRTGNKRTISLPSAMKFNQMGLLGDSMIGTTSPLICDVLIEPKPINPLKKKIVITSRITAVKMRSVNKEIKNREIAKFAYLLFNFGLWKARKLFDIVKNNVCYGSRFIASTPEKEDRQNFQIIATLSMLYINMYNHLTQRKKGLPYIYPKRTMPSIKEIIPKNPFHKGLPLWIFNLSPNNHT